MTRTAAEHGPTEVTLQQILKEELDQIRLSREARLGPREHAGDAGRTLIGLAFSGGGIRSATFNLGVLQGLAQSALLRTFDYLSTVSGGGYIGGWLMAWMQHQKIGIQEVEQKLAPKGYRAKDVAESSEVRFLRNYSNYLTPRKGILGADFWAFVASYLRNTLLNLMILLLLLISLLLLPRSIAYLPHALIRCDDWGWGLYWLTGKSPGDTGFAQYWALVLAMACGLIGVVSMGLNLCWIEPPKGPQPKQEVAWIEKPWAIQVFIVAPLFISAALFSYGLDQIFRYDLARDQLVSWTVLIGFVAYTSLWAVACAARWAARRFVWRNCSEGPKSWVILLPALLTGALGGLVILPYAYSVNGQPSPETMMGVWKVLTFGTPALVATMLLIGALHIGLMGRQFLDAYREWWARLGGCLAIYTGGWFLLFLIVAYVPLGLKSLFAYDTHQHRLTASGVLVWIASTLYGVLFGKSSKTESAVSTALSKKKLFGWIAQATPYVFILGLLVGLSVLSARIAAFAAGQPFALDSASESADYSTVIVCIASLAAAALLSWRVDINAFSMHLLYRNRLTRCYLGASVAERVANPFTGFSAEDDFPLASLKIPAEGEDKDKDENAGPWSNARPIPILNASLNVERGKELALQTRKARSFMMTPSYSGYTRPPMEGSIWQSAFAETKLAGADKPGTEHGPTLGTAIAISGAAASPNMGSYSSAALAFLMTVFDVRLGWWVGNPRKSKWTRGSPDLGFWCLLQELFGAASDESEYVYLSDGGHFENLGIYELVRRGCKLIVACDASCDPQYKFGDLHNAMERCRTDFGVEIVRETHNLVPQNGRVSGHFDVCRIRYNACEEKEDGFLLYLKPGLMESDPEDLIGYKEINPAFPHDSTADQWFDENHFENYRNLGYVSALAVREQLCGRVGHLLQFSRSDR